jgi:hypothetical protein
MTFMADLSGHGSVRYESPDITLFRKWGHGYIWIATRAIRGLELNFQWVNQGLANIALGHSSLNKVSVNLVGLYSYLAEADEAIVSLETMTKEELAKHVALDGPVDIERLKIRFEELYASIEGLEMREEKILQETLNHQMVKRLNVWSGYLDWAQEKTGRPSVDGDEEHMESIDDFAGERDVLEYFRLAMKRVRNVPIHEKLKTYNGSRRHAIARLPYIKMKEFEVRLHDLEERFRTVLGDRRALKFTAFWTDSTFWWNHP